MRKDEKTVTMPKQEYDDLLKELECLKEFKEEFSKDKIVKACILERDYIFYSAMWGHPSVSRVIPEKELEIVDPSIVDKEILQMNCAMQENMTKLHSELGDYKKKEELYDSIKKDLETNEGTIGKLRCENEKLECKFNRLKDRIDSANERGPIARLFIKKV